MMKSFMIALSAVFVLSFSSHTAEAKLMNGVSGDGRPVFLSEPSEISRAIKKFKLMRDLTTEEGKIDYILSRVRSSQLKFIRNGMETDGDAAAQFMRWKIGWYEDKYKTKIKTPHDFISNITKGSEKTGKPYVLILPDGSQHNAQSILQNEENKLEELLAST